MATECWADCAPMFTPERLCILWSIWIFFCFQPGLWAETERGSLPLYKTIPAAAPEELTPANGWPPQEYFQKWYRSHGDIANTRYSTLDQITKDNVKDLEVAWIYRSGDLRSKSGRNLQANPMVLDGVIYTPTIGHALVALDGRTGEELWRFLPDERWRGYEGEYTAQRGLTYWPGDENHEPRLLFNSGQSLYAVHPKTGQPIESFGQGGRSEMGIVAVAGAIYKNVIVLPSKWYSAIFGYDVITGEQLWRFNTAPQEGELNYDPAAGKPTWSVFCWGGMALDESRGLAFFGMSDSNLDQAGGPGMLTRNLYANCVLALHAETGEYAWHFQEIRHDLWDLDIPAPPILVTVDRGGKKVDAVVAMSKMGNTLLLDRVTGKPLFPFRLRRAPESAIPEVKTWPYQPDLELPEPITDQEFGLEDVTDRTPEARDYVLKQLENMDYGWFMPFQELDRRIAFFAVHGGAQWTGGSFDPESRILYISSNDFPWFWEMTDYTEAQGRQYDEGRKAYAMHCAVCHGPERQGVGLATSLVGISRRYTDWEPVRKVIKEGINTMAPVMTITEEEIDPLLKYLFAEGERPEGERKVVFSALGRFQDHEGFPASKPPWSHLVALNLNTGRITWKVPLGEFPGMPEERQPAGGEQFGGPSVTAGGLVFCAGTRDHKIRAFDKDTGETLWEYEMEYGGYAPPAIYEVDGRQFVVIAASSGGNVGGELGDTYYAFALPERMGR